MGFYSNVIFPRILDIVMTNREMTEQRDVVLREVHGDVFEIGFGTGLNLSHYPENVKKLTIVDPNPGCYKRAKKRIAESPIEVESHLLSGEKLPFEDERFDSVVCTWTLCSIPNVDQALGEMRRVLRPEGRMYFIEHGLAPEPNVQKWQNRLNRMWGKIGDGCNLNRNMRELIQDNRFRFVDLENFYMKGPKFASYMYRGVAARA